MEKKSKIIKQDQVDDDISLESRLDMEEFAEGNNSVEKKVYSQAELKARDVAGGIIERAQDEAQLIKEKAKNIYQQVEDRMAEAKQQGYDEGRQEGLATVTEELAKIQQTQESFMAEVEKESISVIYEIAKKIMGDNLQTSDEAIVGMMRNALQSSMGNQLTLFVHPNDYERIKDQETTLMNVLQATQTLNIRPTENVQELGCVIESELGTIDAQLDYQLDAIKRALGL
ncbi:MAG: FliH/SctL family protein [bacterium]